MRAEDAAAVAQLARELTAAVEDPEPVLNASDLVRDGMGPERWFDCLVAVSTGAGVGVAVGCRGVGGANGKSRVLVGGLFCSQGGGRGGGGPGVLIVGGRPA